MNFVTRMEKLTDEQRLHFYELLSHNLTVAIRVVWSDDTINDTEKVDRMKWINELLHRVTAKVWVLRLRTHEWSEQDFGELVREMCNSYPGISEEVLTAIERSYRSVTGEPIGGIEVEQS